MTLANSESNLSPKIASAFYSSPVGMLEIIGTEEAVMSVLFTEKVSETVELSKEMPTAVRTCWIQLDEYFRGQRKDFDVPTTVKGTPFQKSVWQSLTHIPYGKTASYRDIAIAVGRDNAVRAVGTANGRNQLTILVPCHRIIGKNGTLTGYAGGLWRKEWLLAHEQQHNV